MEKYYEPPKKFSLITDSINAIFERSELDNWMDKEIYDAYLKQIEVSSDEYDQFLNEALSFEALLKSDYFEMYIDDFWTQSEIKALQQKASFTKKDKAEQDAILIQKFYTRTKAVEREKLLYFALTYTQRVVLISAPSETKEEKLFLGYEWSKTKGKEGIKINNPGGKLYEDTNRKADFTLASIVRNSFSENESQFTDEIKKYAEVSILCNMLDYSRPVFNKILRLGADKRITITSKYTLVKIGLLTTLLKRGKTPVYGNSKIQVIKSGQARGFYEFDFSTKYYLSDSVEVDERQLQNGDILINSTGVGTAGRVTLFNLTGDYVVDSHVTILRPNERIISEFLLLILAVGIGFKALENIADGSSGQIEIAPDTIKNIRIPVPTVDEQRKIIAEYTKIKKEYNNTRMSRDKYLGLITKLLHDSGVIIDSNVQIESLLS